MAKCKGCGLLMTDWAGQTEVRCYHCQSLFDRAEVERLTKEVEILTAMLHPGPSPCGHSSQFAHTEDGGKHIDCYVCEVERLKGLLSERERVVQIAGQGDVGVWLWQGDREDHPESLTCPVLMSAEQARVLEQQLAEARHDAADRCAGCRKNGATA